MILQHAVCESDQFLRGTIDFTSKPALDQTGHSHDIEMSHQIDVSLTDRFVNDTDFLANLFYSAFDAGVYICLKETLKVFSAD